MRVSGAVCGFVTNGSSARLGLVTFLPEYLLRVTFGESAGCEYDLEVTSSTVALLGETRGCEEAADEEDGWSRGFG